MLLSFEMSQSMLNEQEILESKSQKKRDAEQLQALGIELATLPRAQLDKLNLPDALIQALNDLTQLSAHGALRRHRQYIGKLMRQVDDTAPLYAALDAQKGVNGAHTAWLHRLERLRETLLNDDASLSDFLNAHPEVDRQFVRQLIRNARRERLENKPPKAFRQLFQELKNYLPPPESAQIMTDKSE